MLKYKKLNVPILLILLTLITQTCRKDRYNYDYVNLRALFPYLTKAFEAQTLKFIKKDVQRSNYGLEGFQTYGDQQPRIWAVEKESTIIAYFSEVEDKTAELKCQPFNPPGQPLQEGVIFINGNFLKKTVFSKKGRYEFHIPANFLNYGSNYLTFKWKYARSPNDFGMNKDRRKFAMGFSYLTFHSKSLKEKKRTGAGKIQLEPTKPKTPGIIIPQAGLVEYFVELPPLPQKIRFRFKLSSRQAYFQDSMVHLAVYSEKGEKILRDFTPRQYGSANRHPLDLGGFANQTIKIVFANSIQNHPNFTVAVSDPVLYGLSGEGIPLFPGLKNPTRKKKNIKPLSSGKKPHVFIYLIDTLRADHVSCYGYSRETTPFIDRFSNQGILFKNCFAVASWTKPAVGSILTGLYPHKHQGEDRKDKLSIDVETLAEVLKAHGYTTIYITPNVNSSMEVNFHQGVDYYLFSKGGNRLERFYHSSEYVDAEFSELMENNPHLVEKPLFAFFHTVDPHDPYTPKEPFLKFKKVDKTRENLVTPDNIRIKKATTGLSPEDLDYLKSLYDCEILHNDYYFGKWLEILKEKNLYENSIIVLVADHGEQFDEHGALFHGQSIYNEEIHVPMVIKFPGEEFSGRQTSIMVSQVDIFPTILDYLGIDFPYSVDGVSLFNILLEKRTPRHLFIKEKLNGDVKSNFIGIIDTGNRTKYIITYINEFFIKAQDIERYDMGRDYREGGDIFEKGNVYRYKGVKFLADYFLQQMNLYDFRKAEQLDLDKLDPEKIKQLRTLGYIN